MDCDDQEFVLFLDSDSNSDGEEGATDMVVVGRIMADISKNCTGALVQMRRIWSVAEAEAPTMRCFDDNLFGISFANKRILDAEIASSPYIISGCNLVLQEWRSGVALEEIRFDHITMWVQVYNLPRDMLTVWNLNMVGNRLGTVVSVEDPFADGLGRGFARVREPLEIRKPLVKELTLRRSSVEQVKVSLKYEKLQEFCYYCGKIGHVLKSCSEVANHTDLSFSAKLRADPVRSLMVPRGK